MRSSILFALVAISLVSTAVSAAKGPDRPAEAVALDEGRKPTETLAFLGLKPGMQAADIITGSGYWAEIMADIVGDKGSVTAYEPTQFYTTPKEQQVLADLKARQPGIRVIRYPFDAFAAAPRSFDFAMINLNYHDLYWESAKFHIPHTDPAAFLRMLFAAMKPGGVVGVIDHAGPAGDTRAVVEKLHRIDPATVKADFAAAGFVLEATSDLLSNPADDHSKGVFDPALRGHTDRFVFRFRKPR